MLVSEGSQHCAAIVMPCACVSCGSVMQVVAGLSPLPPSRAWRFVHGVGAPLGAALGDAVVGDAVVGDAVVGAAVVGAAVVGNALGDAPGEADGGVLGEAAGDAVGESKQVGKVAHRSCHGLRKSAHVVAVAIWLVICTMLGLPRLQSG